MSVGIRRWKVAWWAATVALLAGSCGQSTDTTDVAAEVTSRGSETSGSEDGVASESTIASDVSGHFDVGGRSLAARCRGTGAPTIVFLHGGAGSSSHGSHLLDVFGDRVRVCVYDRAGMGRSDPADGPASGAAASQDLDRLLDAMEVPGPYLLVAYSFGGLIALVHAAEHPDETAGIVFVDASLHSDADLDAHLAEHGVIDLDELASDFEAAEEPFVYTIHEEARAAVDALPRIPLTYLLATQFDLPDAPQDVLDEMHQIRLQSLDDLLARSSHGRLVDVDSPHVIPPEPIQAAVDEMLDHLGV